MKICIDARMWGIKHTGIGRYVENLIDNLPGEAVLIVPRTSKRAQTGQVHQITPVSTPTHSLSQLEMLWILSFIRPDVLHVPHFTIPVFWPGKMVVTIHDLIKHMSKGRDTTTHNPIFYWPKYFGYLAIVWLAVHRARHIIVPAKYWKSILVKISSQPS